MQFARFKQNTPVSSKIIVLKSFSENLAQTQRRLAYNTTSLWGICERSCPIMINCQADNDLVIFICCHFLARFLHR